MVNRHGLPWPTRGVARLRRTLQAVVLATLLSASLSASACFRYVSVPATAVSPNEDVRLRITNDAALRLVRELGIYRAELEGQLAPQGTDSVAISILIGRDYRGTSFENVRHTVPVGRAEVVEVRRRQFSLGRTALATAGGVALFVILVRSIFQQENPNRDRDPQPPPPPGGVRVFHIR